MIETFECCTNWYAAIDQLVQCFTVYIAYRLQTRDRKTGMYTK